MASQTLAQVQKQIALLEAKAAKLREAEKAGVIARIKEAIKVYGIAPPELYASTPVKAKSKQKNANATSTPRFSDGTGNTWVGRGPYPQWVRDALDAGKTLADFAVGGGTTHTTAKNVSNRTAAKKTASKAAKKRAKKPGNAKYADQAGNSWSGRGPQPNWLKDALASGKTLDDLRA
jgi:DNA-binding protein H-NS